MPQQAQTDPMPQQPPIIVVDVDGRKGVVAPDSPLVSDPKTQWLVRFESGEQIVVPTDLLRRQEDGHYLLALSVDQLLQGRGQHLAESSLTIPVIEEQIQVQRQATQTGKVEIRKTVHERMEVVDEPLMTEEVEIERVAINRPVEEPISPRHEGDTLVIPLLEEVLVVEKRLMLREEVRVKKVRTESHAPQQVSLRSEQVDVVRTPGPGGAGKDGE